MIKTKSMTEENVRKPFQIKGKDVIDESGNVIAVLVDPVDEFNERTIAMAPTAVDEVIRFVELVESGSFKPKTSYKRFKAISDRINE